MDIETLEQSIEGLSEEVHNAWMKEKLAQGFHSPHDCPKNTFQKLRFNAICEKCHPDLYPYSELPANIKEYDRVTVRAVLSAIKKLEGE